MAQLSDRVQTFTDSVIRRMTRISNKYGAINLSQGFPDNNPPQELMDALAKAAYAGPHQYAITFGAKNFRDALALKQGRRISREIDPETEIVVTCGSTEAMMCAMMTICNPGDKVLVFSPFYENYGADAILSGADPIYIPLVPPSYDFDPVLLEEGFQQGAKAIIVCNPSNPCGKVFTRQELTLIGSLAQKYDAFVVTDEVYEHLVYDPYEHICMASLSPFPAIAIIHVAQQDKNPWCDKCTHYAKKQQRQSLPEAAHTCGNNEKHYQINKRQSKADTIVNRAAKLRIFHLGFCHQMSRQIYNWIADQPQK